MKLEHRHEQREMTINSYQMNKIVKTEQLLDCRTLRHMNYQMKKKVTSEHQQDCRKTPKNNLIMTSKAKTVPQQDYIVQMVSYYKMSNKVTKTVSHKGQQDCKTIKN